MPNNHWQSIKLPQTIIVESYINRAIAAVETINNPQSKANKSQSKAPKLVTNALDASSLSLSVSGRTASPLNRN